MNGDRLTGEMKSYLYQNYVYWSSHFGRKLGVNIDGLKDYLEKWDIEKFSIPMPLQKASKGEKNKKECQLMMIRQEQLESLSAYMKENFVERLVRKLEASHAAFFAEFEGAAELWIEAALAKCARYGIASEDDVTEVAERMVLEGYDFEFLAKNKHVLAIFEDEEIAGEEKLYELYKKELELSYEADT